MAYVRFGHFGGVGVGGTGWGGGCAQRGGGGGSVLGREVGGGGEVGGGRSLMQCDGCGGSARGRMRRDSDGALKVVAGLSSGC